MRMMIDFGDALARPLLRLLGLINLLAFVSFLVVLASAAHAEEKCGGNNLLDQLRADDPAAMARVEAESAEVPNGQGTLWKIEKQGVARSWLFGTIHVSDPRVTALTAAAKTAFDAASVVVIETTDAVDPKAMMGVLAKRPDLMMFTDGETLTSGLSAEDAALINARLDARGIPHDSVAKMKPWMLASMLAVPACENERKANGKPFLDQMLAQDAKADGKTLVGLETGLEQLEAIASLPMALHRRSLVDLAKLGDGADDVAETMIDLYVEQRIGMYWPLFRQATGEKAGSDADQDAFEQRIVTDRNVVMADRALPILAGGNAFIAVGSLHLPGKDGVIELLRNRGYTVSRADS